MQLFLDSIVVGFCTYLLGTEYRVPSVELNTYVILKEEDPGEKPLYSVQSKTICRPGN